MATKTELRREIASYKRKINVLFKSVKMELNKRYSDLGYIKEKLNRIYDFSYGIARDKNIIYSTKLNKNKKHG